jgi:hypothetical protein
VTLLVFSKAKWLAAINALARLIEIRQIWLQSAHFWRRGLAAIARPDFMHWLQAQ